MFQVHTRPLRQAAAVLSVAVLALVAACGGGSDAVSVPTGGTAAAASFSQGAISGFGSVIVNGVRWDDSAASVTDDDGVRRSSADLKLGMVIEVDGSSVDRSTGSGRALAIRYGSEMLGPIAAIDSVASTLTVLGQTVLVTTSTVFDTTISGGLAGLAAGNVIEIHGLYDAANSRTVATRIELKPAATEYRLRGSVSALDTVNKTLRIGSELISYATVPEVPATLANGVAVKVRLQTVPVAGAWVVTKLRLVKRVFEDRAEAEVEGVITAWTSATDFEVNGLKVDASNAAFPEGQAAVVLGARVEVEGAVVNGVLVATKVHLEDDEEHGGMGREFELHGRIANLDTAAKTFALRGLTVSYAGAVTFKDGTEATLLNDVKVEVKGTLSADLTTIVASRIEFE
jgi:hypothetical protein